MTSLISTQIHDAGEALINLARTPGLNIGSALNAELNRFLGWPFRADSGIAKNHEGLGTGYFSSIIHVKADSTSPPQTAEVSADALACVIDVSDSMNLGEFRAAYLRVAHAKSLRKSEASQIKDGPHRTGTLGIIFAVRTDLPLEKLAEELDRLNRITPSTQWPDMMISLSTGTINYAAQFPGEKLGGDFFLPTAENAPLFTLPMYIVTVVKPAGAYSFNKMCAFVIAHLALFSPGASLPNFVHVLEGTPKQVMTFSGYQFNLSGQLVPVPLQFYSDRYIPPRPVRVEDGQGNCLAELQYLPWQDGGVVMSTGKLPLEGLLVFLGKKAIARSGIVRRGDRQISYGMPITAADFGQMLTRIQQQSNMVVRADPTELVVQKLANEGSTSPVMARLFMGILALRDTVFPDAAERWGFDKAYEATFMTLLNTRTTADQIKKLFSEHAEKVARGDIARVQGSTLYIDENIDKELRKQTEDFLNGAVRVIKQGMRDVTSILQVNIGFLFKKSSTFASALSDLQRTDGDLAEYLREARRWSERLVESRNAMEHASSALPKIKYSRAQDGVQAEEPQIAGQPVSEFALFMVDRLACFVEEVTAHCLQIRLPDGFTFTELPLANRNPEGPIRFRVTLRAGGLPAWSLAYHESKFDET
jgi:hypothetical protein